MKDLVITVEEAAKLLHLHPFTVLKLIKAKRLKAVKIGRVYRIRESALDTFLDESST